MIARTQHTNGVQEKTIVDFSKKQKRGNSKSPHMNPPISREKQKRAEENKKDEKEIAKRTAITERIQKKEEETLEEKDDSQTFTDRLETLSDRPKSVLMHISTFFPFDFFPDDITIDPIKIQITNKFFFRTEKIESILIKDIQKTFVVEGPMMATLKIITSDDKTHPTSIGPLKREKAQKALKIIQGLVIGRSEAPDIKKNGNN